MKMLFPSGAVAIVSTLPRVFNLANAHRFTLECNKDGIIPGPWHVTAIYTKKNGTTVLYHYAPFYRTDEETEIDGIVEALNHVRLVTWKYSMGGTLFNLKIRPALMDVEEL